MKFRFNRMLLAMVIPAMLAAPVTAQDDTPAESNQAEEADNTAAEKPQPVDNSFVIRMRNNKYLKGVPMELPFIDVYILGTKVAVPLDQVLGVRFAQAANEKSTIALKNGEMLTGRIDAPKVNLAVDWGEATINPEVITAMVRNANMQWTMRNSPSGPQWFLGPQTYRSSMNYRRPAPRVAAPARPAPAFRLVPPVQQVTYNRPVRTNNIAFPTIDPAEFYWIW